MCGIAGIVNIDEGRPISVDELQRMVDTLVHRGPDDQGTYIDSRTGCCGLAHRRLAIIDIENGQQPLSNEDRSLWITYNGECYNFQQLRHDLESLGHHFRTNCDTEVIVHLYEEYGSDCVNYIRGMFALAIWDQRKQQLFMARDRMGQKPLYYGLHNGRFIFASQCKAILQTDTFPRRPDLEAIRQYLLLQYIPPPNSGFADIRMLPPAHTMTIQVNKHIIPQPRRYWSIPSQPTFTGTLDQAASMVKETLTQATQMRMISDVPLGAFLSGGIDSTIVVGLMSQAQNAPVKTSAVGFEEGLYNELKYARIAAQRFQCDHQEHIVRANCAQGVETLSQHFDEPFADSSALPTWQLSQVTRRDVTVALTGDGGDECFGGYDRYRAMRLAQKVNSCRYLSWLARRGFWHNISTGDYRGSMRKLKRFMTAALLPPQRRYLKWIAVFDPDMLGNLLIHDKSAPDYWDHLAHHFQPTDAFGNDDERYVGQAMLSDGRQYLPGDLNTKIDRASMACSLELRCPFQDHKVVELAYSLPTAYRHNGKISKLVLRKAFNDLIPPSINRRKKMGFGVPVGQWFRGELRPIFIDTVLSPRALQRGYFNRAAIENLLQENDQKRHDHGHRLWSLLMLELWHRRYIDSPQTS